VIRTDAAAGSLLTYCNIFALFHSFIEACIQREIHSLKKEKMAQGSGLSAADKS